jgi:hypothetical protein
VLDLSSKRLHHHKASTVLFTALICVHLAGLALGLGGATIGDLLILRAMARGGPFPTDQLKDLSWAIWIGVATLTASGLLLFAMKPTTYLHSSGFVAKMIVVGVLILNGLVLHSRLSTLRLSTAALLLGAISTVSWYASMAIAMFRSKVHLSVIDYMSIYLIAIAIVWRLNWRLYEHFASRYGPALPSESAEGSDRGATPAVRAGDW